MYSVELASIDFVDAIVIVLFDKHHNTHTHPFACLYRRMSAADSEASRVDVDMNDVVSYDTRWKAFPVFLGTIQRLM